MLFEMLSRWPGVASAFVALQAQPEIQYFSLRDPEPEPSLAWFILNAFFFIGVALVVMIAFGVAFGSFRYWLLGKFPHNWLNGAPEDDVSATFRLNDTPGADEIRS